MDNKSVKRIFEILDLFSTQGPELGVSEVARQIGINKSTSSRILSTLESISVLRKNQESKKYRLNGKILELARATLSAMDIKTTAMPYVKELNARTEELVQIHVRQGDQRCLLAWLESPRPIRRVIDSVHMYGPLHAGAPGKIMLAYMHKDEVNEIIARTGLPAYTQYTITDKNKLLQELEKIREQGAAFSMGEHREFMFTASAPIYNYLGAVAGALSISWLEMGHKPELTQKYTDMAKETALKISHGLGYQLFSQPEATNNAWLVKKI